MKLEPIITTLLENDAYKFSMGQAIYHQHGKKMANWSFKCRNKAESLYTAEELKARNGLIFTAEEVEEITEQIKHYCSLRFTEAELLALQKVMPWLKDDYIDFLRFWHPRFEDFKIGTNSPCGLSIEIYGSDVMVSPYETPVMAIVCEVHYRMSGHYEELLKELKEMTEREAAEIKAGVYRLGGFSEFGFRRRLSFEAQDYFVKRFAEEKIPSFLGTSNVFLAVKYGTKASGTMAHEYTMLCGQGYPERNPAYSNKFMLESWVKEYGIQNGIALTDTIGTPAFLRDFNQYYATVFSGVRHDSADPIEWGEKMIAHYKSLGIDPKTKLLLFSDSLNLKKATELYDYFKDKAKVGFGIGTSLVGAPRGTLNIVIKTTEINGRPVAKLSDCEGKNMCKDPEYIDYLKKSVAWRLNH